MSERLTKENIEYVGDVYSKELHPMVHDLITENLILQSELAAEREAHRWIPVSEKLPEDDGSLNESDCSVIFTGNEYEIISCAFYCRFKIKDADDCFYYDKITYDFTHGEWEMYFEGQLIDIEVTHWQPLPEPPKE